MLKNTKDSYGSITKLFHWTMAIIILCLLVVGFLLEDLKMPILYKAHKTIGFLILLLAIARLLWRFANQTPSYAELPKWMAFAATNAEVFEFICISDSVGCVVIWPENYRSKNHPKHEVRKL